MKQEILEAYKALKINNPKEPENLAELKVEINNVKSTWRELIKKYNPDNGEIPSEEITKRINLAKEALEDYFEELKQTLPEQSQEIAQETTVENEPKEAVEEVKSVYPKHDETVREWEPKEFETKKARETYDEDNTGFKKGFGFDKRV